MKVSVGPLYAWVVRASPKRQPNIPVSRPLNRARLPEIVEKKKKVVYGDDDDDDDDDVLMLIMVMTTMTVRVRLVYVGKVKSATLVDCTRY